MKVQIITAILMFALITLLPSLITKDRLKDKDILSINEGECKKEFTILWWFYPMACIIPTLGIFLLFAGIKSTIQYYLGWEEVFSMGLGVSLILFSIATFSGLTRMRISIRDGIFIYNNGFKIKYKIPINQIKSVIVDNGNIVIDDGDEYKKLVPIYFNDIKTIVRVLSKN
jgi:hypothetical protein